MTDEALRLVLAAEHQGHVIYQYGYAWVTTEQDRTDSHDHSWLLDPLRSESYDRRRSTIEWASGWPVETLHYPRDEDFHRNPLPSTRNQLLA